MSYFQDFSNIEKKIEQNNEILVIKQTLQHNWKMKKKNISA